MKIQEYKESDFQGIFRVKLIAKNINKLNINNVMSLSEETYKCSEPDC